MQCGCPECGRLMGQVERAERSACVCPDCGFSCRLCLGGQTTPLNVDQLRQLYDQGPQDGDLPEADLQEDISRWQG